MNQQWPKANTNNRLKSIGKTERTFQMYSLRLREWSPQKWKFSHVSLEMLTRLLKKSNTMVIFCKMSPFLLRKPHVDICKITRLANKRPCVCQYRWRVTDCYLPALTINSWNCILYIMKQLWSLTTYKRQNNRNSDRMWWSFLIAQQGAVVLDIFM